jgi:hypothetical protein
VNSESCAALYFLLISAPLQKGRSKRLVIADRFTIAEKWGDNDETLQI